MHRAASWMLVVATLGTPALAADRGVTIGEVSSQVARRGVDYEPLLRAASEQELSSVDFSRVPSGTRVIVSVALVRLDTTAERRVTDARCKVSATLRDARRGTVFAILESEARASGGDPREAVENDAVHGALRGVLGRIPDVLRR